MFFLNFVFTLKDLYMQTSKNRSQHNRLKTCTSTGFNDTYGNEKNAPLQTSAIPSRRKLKKIIPQKDTPQSLL